MRVLGLSAYGADSAAALVEDGRIVAAAQEERFSRRKNEPGFPWQAMDACLAEAGLSLNDVDCMAVQDRHMPSRAPHRSSRHRSSMRRGPQGPGSAILFNRGARARRGLARARPPVVFVPHQEAHAASAFFPSPFDEAAVLVIDGPGQKTATSLWVGEGSRLRRLWAGAYPHSLDLLYSAFAHYLGFKVGSGEFKVMGLAPFGEPRFAEQIKRRLIVLRDDGSFRLNMRFFRSAGAGPSLSGPLSEIFGLPARQPWQPLSHEHMDLAASIQAVIEEAVLGLARAAAAQTGQSDLCLAGTVALNCVANGRILRDGCFERLWIQPAAGDAGGALGAALAAYHRQDGDGNPRVADSDSMSGAFLGPAFAQDEIEERLAFAGARYETLGQDRVIDQVVDALVDGQAVGWFQGRMEFGPRALGARSILGDPRSPAMQRILNLKVKNREWFRPFAPSVLREDAGDWFDLDVDSPYMLLVAPVGERQRRPLGGRDRTKTGFDRLDVVRSTIPAVTHVDGSARVQTVDARTNPRFHALLSAFKAHTGCPVLINTSFNVRGEPIVCTPEDAFRCFMGTDIDMLAIGDSVVRKGDQNPALVIDHTVAFELD